MALSGSNGRRPHQDGEVRDSAQDEKIYDSSQEKRPAQRAWQSEGGNDGSSAQGTTQERTGKRQVAWRDESAQGYPNFSREETAEAEEDSRPDILRVNTRSEGGAKAEQERQKRNTKKKSDLHRMILMGVIEVLTLAMIFCVGFVARYMNKTQEVPFDVEKVKNTNLDITKQQQMEGYWTVAVFGVDSRNGNLGKGALADVQIIVNIDLGSGDIKMASVYRDTYMYTGKRYAKINEAYSVGGPEGAVAALNNGLDLDIQNYATFNWKAVIDVIDMLGGVEADVTKGEFREMNAYITETSLESGYSLNPAAYYISGPGQQHLSGVQAVAYARLRHADTDFKRTERQRAIIAQLLEKAKKADLATLTELINTVLPQISFNMDAGDILQLAKGISRYNIVGSTGFPTDLKTQMMGKKGDCVIPTTLASNVKTLHAFLYDDEDYDPSSAVWTYSQKIAEDSGNYKSSAEASEAEKKAAEDKESRAVESSKRAAEAETETDENGETIKASTSASETTKSSTKKTYETDEDGNYVDEDGNVLETDEDGDVIESTSTRTTTAAETDADGNRVTTEAETDPEGNLVTTAAETTRSGEVTAADPSGTTASTESTSSPGSSSSSSASATGTVTPSGTTAASTSGSSSTTITSPTAATTASSTPSATTAAPVSPGSSTTAAEGEEDVYNGPGTIVE